jgi:inositol oxygenase
MLQAVKAFNPYDLYSKSDDVPSVEELKVSSPILSASTRLIKLTHISQPYYLELIDEFFPNKVIKW